MIRYFDLNLKRFVTAPGYSTEVRLWEFKRGDAAAIELVFIRGTVRELLGGTNEIRFAIKEAGKYDADPVVFLDAWVEGADSYTGSPNFNTEELDALLANDGDDSNDIAYVDAMLEVTFTRDDGATWTSSDTITARLNNDVVRGDEGVPVAGAPVYPAAQEVLDAVDALTIESKEIAGTAYELILEDSAKFLQTTNAAAVGVTVPANADVAFAVGDSVAIEQAGAGQITVAGAAGVTVNTSETLKSRTQYASLLLIKTAADVWSLHGERELA